METETDDRGRITIPKDAREKYGDRYRIVELKDGLKLIPIPDDPMEDLKGVASEKLKETPIEELRKSAEQRGREEARESLGSDTE